MSRPSQQTLFPVAAHSGRGLEWERELEAVHHWYRLQGWADIVKNPCEWIFIGEREYSTLLIENPSLVACCGDQRKIKRIQSDVDYSGGGSGCLGVPFSICFDAKMCAGDKISIANFRPHQIHRIRQSARCGVIAGFMVRFNQFDRVFFIPNRYMQIKYENYLKNKIGRRAKPGTASYTAAELSANAIEIFRHTGNGLWDWMRAILPIKH